MLFLIYITYMSSLGTLLSREVTMQTKIDRRSFLAAAVLGCSSILVPREAFSIALN